MHAVCFDQPEENRQTICLSNTWGWFRSTKTPDPQLNEGATPPPPCSEVTITFPAASGRPTRVLDALTGCDLPLDPVPNGHRIRVPVFQINACIVADLP